LAVSREQAADGTKVRIRGVLVQNAHRSRYQPLQPPFDIEAAAAIW
jgi:hypothetical protein